MDTRRTAPKPRQIDKSEVIDDNLAIPSVLENLEDELNYIRSLIKAIKGSSSYDAIVSNSLAQLNTRLTNSEGYYHEQSSPSSTWTIVHGLNRYPNIIIFDDEFNQIFADVKMLNVNTVRVTFSESLSGAAFIK